MEQNPNQPLPYDPVKVSQSTFLSAAMFFALLSCTCGSCIIIGSMFFSAMSILFAILSKGKQLKMHILGKVAILLSVCSLAFSTFYTGLSTYMFFTDATLRQESLMQYEQLTGISVEELYEQETSRSLEEDIAYINQLFQ